MAPKILSLNLWSNHLQWVDFHLCYPKINQTTLAKLRLTCGKIVIVLNASSHMLWTKFDTIENCARNRNAIFSFQCGKICKTNYNSNSKFACKNLSFAIIFCRFLRFSCLVYLTTWCSSCHVPSDLAWNRVFLVVFYHFFSITQATLYARFLQPGNQLIFLSHAKKWKQPNVQLNSSFTMTFTHFLASTSVTNELYFRK